MTAVLSLPPGGEVYNRKAYQGGSFPALELVGFSLLPCYKGGYLSLDWQDDRLRPPLTSTPPHKGRPSAERALSWQRKEEPRSRGGCPLLSALTGQQETRAGGGVGGSWKASPFQEGEHMHTHI